MVKELDTLEKATHLVNYTRRDNPGAGPKTMDEKHHEEAEGKGHEVEPAAEGELRTPAQ